MAFQTVQRQFLAHLRNSEKQPLPAGFAEQGAAVYAELLYNKFNDSLELCFPLSREILGAAGWRRLVKDFIADHCCTSPYYRQIPDQFIRYLQTERCSPSDPPFLLELAHFEWVELVLAVTVAEPVPAFTPGMAADSLQYRPLFAPIFQLLDYGYPVQRINAGYQPAIPPDQATHILGFRDRDDAVQFIELQPATARLLDILKSAACTVAEAVTQIAAELGHPDPAALSGFGVETMISLMRQGAILALIAQPESRHE
ncbi:MAG: putative DNA-binding domain-containing protein [Methylococcales bacterium]|nr:putative DNA-binding domain-containing protein [Methylococcales bacterium]